MNGGGSHGAEGIPRRPATAMSEIFIDALGDFCPIPGIKARAAVGKMKPGDRVVLITDHSCAANTLASDMRKAGCITETEEIDYGIWRITIIRPGN